MGFGCRPFFWQFLPLTRSLYYIFTIPIGGRAMSEQRTEGQEQERGQGSATLSKEQIELIGAILSTRQ